MADMDVKLDAILYRLSALEGRLEAEKPLSLEMGVNLLNQVMQRVVDGVNLPMSRLFMQAEDRDRDILETLLNGRFNQKVATIVTDHPVAFSSDDHRFPRGTRTDNSRHPRYVRACEEAFGHATLAHLDLGCSGGGLVWDFLSSGHFSIGIEGSDYSRRLSRAEWRTIPQNLFTADISKPFRVFSADRAKPLAFDVVSAWEVLEHIPEADLPNLFGNIGNALRPGGLFTGSVATFEDRHEATGAVWHVTVKPREWWFEAVTKAGFEVVEGLFQTSDFPRGSGSARVNDWDARYSPELGFHLVFRKP